MTFNEIWKMANRVCDAWEMANEHEPGCNDEIGTADRSNGDLRGRQEYPA